MPLEVTGLGLTLGGSELISGLDLRLRPTGLTVVMGPNGAGKSLLLRLLHGLIAPSRGTVRWGGLPMSPAVMRRQALVFQKPVLLRRSVAANVDFVLRARGVDRRRRDALLARVGLADKAGQAARHLSGGEQQRLCLARALATEPEVLLLDEPTASLDPSSCHAIESIIRDAACNGVRVILVSHDVGQARRLADDVVFLHRGRVTEHRPAREFFENPKTEVARAHLAGRLVL
ncbi:ABC-type tungstate transport system, ATP-binding protein [Rhodovulum sp. P5]|uniref:ATP-binding cassette domain-containing protein n=1 Tax=Rhodovulum sp. P5 TaxID=1564506 RepID=UPI0009C38600|nr:ATP-binding cassette domain-containing protein [Rhodovulum sp. P5]ARE38849.1 ABC-type tungstate transport system, ATP-binding protein [Rhodovulum sp. P5]